MFIMQPGFEFTPGYRLETFLGEGQFGQVWRVSAPGGAVAAVKFVQLSRGQWQREYDGIRRVKNVQHPNLMPITAIWFLGEDGRALHEAPTRDSIRDTVDFDKSQKLEEWSPSQSVLHNAQWLAVSMLLGGNNLEQCLKEFVKQGRDGIPPEKLLGYIGEAAKGIDFLNSPVHDFGDGPIAVQHCDIKPANIVLLGTSAVVCDFGVARILRQDQILATSLAGTAAYMSPETIEQKPSRTSDQYALAITYYQLRANRLPFASESFLEVLRSHQSGTLLFNDVPEKVREVLKKATSLDWQKRFDTCEQMVHALRAAEFPVDPLPVPTPKPWLLGIAAIAGLVILVIGGYGYIVSRHKKTGVVKIEPNVEPPNEGVPERIPDPLNVDEFFTNLKLLDSDPTTALEQFNVLSSKHEELRTPNRVLLQGFEDSIDGLNWLPTTPLSSFGNSTLFAYGGEQIIIYDLSTIDISPLKSPAPLQGVSLAGHSGAIVHFGNSPDLKLAVSADDSGELLVWSLEALKQSIDNKATEAEPLARLSMNCDITSIAWNPFYHKYLVVTDRNRDLHVVECIEEGGDVELKLVNSLQLALEPKDFIKQLAFPGFGNSVTCLISDGKLIKIDWKDLENFVGGADQPVPIPQTISSPGSSVRSFKFVSDSDGNELIAAAGRTGEITIYNLQGELMDRFLKNSVQEVESFDIAGSFPKDFVLASGRQDGMINLVSSKLPQVMLSGHQNVVRDICISKDKNWLVTCGWQDKSFIVRDLAGEPEREFRVRDQQVDSEFNAIEINADNHWVVVGGSNRHLYAWDFRHLRLLTRSSREWEKSTQLPVEREDQEPDEPKQVVDSIALSQ